MNGRIAVSVSVAGVVLVVLVSAAGAAFLAFRGGSNHGSSCRVVADGKTFVLDTAQAANARIIADAAASAGLPHHAVTIGIAAALQESRLHNLSYGDRDSLGLFQQRPSQGWGTPAQILNPQFAAASFFHALARIDGWPTLPVNDAAQQVQHSAQPNAYAVWEPEARALARATTGELPGALSCGN